MPQAHYAIVTGSDPGDLVDAVNALIAQGGEPLGGVAFEPYRPAVDVRHSGGGSYESSRPAQYLQAMRLPAREGTQYHGPAPAGGTSDGRTFGSGGGGGGLGSRTEGRIERITADAGGVYSYPTPGTDGRGGN